MSSQEILKELEKNISMDIFNEDKDISEARQKVNQMSQEKYLQGVNSLEKQGYPVYRYYIEMDALNTLSHVLYNEAIKESHFKIDDNRILVTENALAKIMSENQYVDGVKLSFPIVRETLNEKSMSYIKSLIKHDLTKTAVEQLTSVSHAIKPQNP